MKVLSPNHWITRKFPWHAFIGYHAVAAAAKSLQSCPTLCDPRDGNPSGSPVPGILQARTLEWVASSFSNAWKWKVKVKMLSHVQLLVTPWTAAYQAHPSMGFSRQENWNGLLLSSPLVIIETFEKLIHKTGSPLESEKLPWNTPMARIMQAVFEKIKAPMIISGSWWQVGTGSYYHLHLWGTKTVFTRAKVHSRSCGPPQKTQLPIHVLPPTPKLLGWTDHTNDKNADRHNFMIDYSWCWPVFIVGFW